MVKRGIVAGLLGATVVAVWFFLLDVVAGHAFQTPAALGSSLLFGKTEVEMSIRTIGAYTTFHFIMFMLGGVLFVWVAEKIERRPSFLLVAILFLIVVEALALVNLASYAQWGLGALGAWSVTIANVLAIAVMGLYIWSTHPRLRDIGEHPPNAVRV